jgi:ABC transporter transmembrane region.
MRAAFPFGLALVLVLLKVTKKIAKQIGDIYIQLMKIKDKRIGLTEDVINGIKAIKCLGWEQIFHDRIMETREEEFQLIKKIKYLDVYCVLLWSMTSISLITVTLIAYNLIGYDLKETNIFTVKLNLFIA